MAEPITPADRVAFRAFAEHALRHLSVEALRDVDPDAGYQHFANCRARHAYPATMSPALADVLGMPPQQLFPVWMALREVGQEIGRRYEAEVAAALHFLIPIAIEHGDDWRRAAADKLLELRAVQEARA